RVAAVWGQIEPRREYQRLLEKRAATGVDVRAWQIAGHRIRTGAAAARRQERQSGGEDDDTSFCHINSYETEIFRFHQDPSLPGRQLQHVAHREDAVSPNQPVGGGERPLRKNATVAGDVRQGQLLERRVEDQLVR